MTGEHRRGMEKFYSAISFALAMKESCSESTLEEIFGQKSRRMASKMA